MRDSGEDSGNSDETKHTTSTAAVTSSTMVVESSRTAVARGDLTLPEERDELQEAEDQMIAQALAESLKAAARAQQPDDSGIVVEQPGKGKGKASEPAPLPFRFPTLSPEPDAVSERAESIDRAAKWASSQAGSVESVAVRPSRPSPQSVLSAEPIAAGPSTPKRPRRGVVARNSPPPIPPYLYSGKVSICAPLFPVFVPQKEELERKVVRAAKRARRIKFRAKTPDLDHPAALEQCHPAWWEVKQSDDEDIQETPVPASTVPIVLSPRKAVTKLRAGAYTEMPRIESDEEEEPVQRLKEDEDKETRIETEWTTIADHRMGASYNPPDPPSNVRGGWRAREEWITDVEACWALERILPDRAEQHPPVLMTRPPSPKPARADRMFPEGEFALRPE